jgi:hypothetical protein
MALSAAQINAMYAALFGPGHTPDAAQLAAWEALDATQGDAAVISGIVTSPASMEYDYAIVQILQFVQGVVPTAFQLQNWVSYLESGGSITSVVTAFAEGTVFQNNFNGGNPVNVSAPVTATIAYNIIAAALGTVPSMTDVNGWVATGISTAQMLGEFALGDQYSARTASFVENYLTHIAAQAAGVPGAAAPSGSLFTVTVEKSITDSTTGETTTAGDMVTFTVHTIGVVAGTQYTWVLTGSALNEVTTATSGTVTIGTNGTGSVTVDTVYNAGQGSGTLTFTVADPVADTITINPPSIQHFTTAVGETLMGDPNGNTTFIGVVDTVIVGNNTYTSIADSAQGFGSNNTLFLIVNNEIGGGIITPNATGVQTFEVSDTNGVSSTTNFNMQLMPNLTTIELFANNQYEDDFYNVQNVVNFEFISNDFSGPSTSVEIFVTNAAAAAYVAAGGGPVTLTLENVGSLSLEYQNTSGGPFDSSADFVTAFDIVNSGDNYLQLWGASQATTITVTGTGSLWMTFDGTVSGYNFHDHDLYKLTNVDASGLSGAYDTTEYQFGFDPDIFNNFTFLGAQGNTFVDIKDDTAGHGNAVTNISITTYGGNDKIHVDTSFGNGETVTVNSGGGVTTNMSTGSGRGGDSIDLHGWKATNQILTVNSGDGNNNVNVVTADSGNVTVNQGNGNNFIDIDIWNNQVQGLPDGTAAMVNVTIGDGTNKIFINTDKTGVYGDDEGSHVTVAPDTDNGNDNYVLIRSGYDSTTSVTLGNGNGDTVDVENQGSDDTPYTLGTFGTNSTINVGTGGTLADPISITYNDGSASDTWGNENVTINAGVGGGGHGSIEATIGAASVVTETVGDGSYSITDYVKGQYSTATVTVGNGNNKINIDLDGSTSDTANVLLGDGSNYVGIYDAPGALNMNAYITGLDGLTGAGADGNNIVNVVFDETSSSSLTPYSSGAYVLLGNGANDITVTLNDSGSNYDLAYIVVGNGDNCIAVHGIGYGSDNFVEIITGSGDNSIYLGSLDTSADYYGYDIYVQAGGYDGGATGFNTLQLNAYAAGQAWGPDDVLANFGTYLAGFSALEITDKMYTSVNLYDFGAGNAINTVTLDGGHGNVTLAGLGNNATLNLLWGDSFSTLSVPISGSIFNPNDTFNLLLDSQYSPGGGGTLDHHYGTIDLTPFFGGGIVENVNITSTSGEGIYPSDPTDDYANVINHVSLIDPGIEVMTINGALGGGDGDVAVPGQACNYNGVPTEDGDVYLNLNGSFIPFLHTVNADSFYAGIERTDLFATFSLQSNTVGHLEGGLGGTSTVELPFQFFASNTTMDDLVFGNGNIGGAPGYGDQIYLGNYDNIVTVGDGNGDTLELTATTNVYGSSQGGNYVNVGNGIDDFVFLDNNDNGDGNIVILGNTSLGGGAGNGSKVVLGSGGNVSGNSVTINGYNSTPGVSGADDTVTVTFDGSGPTSGGNTITPHLVTGSTINLGTHTIGDTIVFNDVHDSAVGYNDMITGFHGAGAYGTGGAQDIIDLSGIIGADPSSFFQVATGADALVQANSNTAGHDMVIYAYKDGSIYDFHGSTGATATPDNTLEVSVDVTGSLAVTAANIHF